MIERCDADQFDRVLDIINDGAEAYRGVIPEDRWHDPYMTREQLRAEISAGVIFWGYTQQGQLAGVMGIQDVRDVTLIRHAYVRTAHRNQGIGGQLMTRLKQHASRPLLVGTWAAADWAVQFYQKHGFQLVAVPENDQLLQTYWSLPPRQVETSVVLADPQWFQRRRPLVAQRADTPPLNCPFGQVERIVTGGAGGIANVHVVTVSEGAPHVHAGYDEVYYLLAGTGTMTLDQDSHPLQPGSVVVIPAGVPHALHADKGQRLEFVIFGTPAMPIDDQRAQPRTPPHEGDASAD